MTSFSNLKFATLTLITTLALALPGCGPAEPELSESEREQRQELALDLAGRYQEQTTVEQKTLLLVANEQRHHDIRIEFNLARSLSEVERALLRSSLQRVLVRISDEEIATLTAALEKHLASLILGEGAGFKSRGGENVALDAKGTQSEVAVKSARSRFHQSTFGSTVESFASEATLFMTAHGSSPRTLDYRVTRDSDDESRHGNGAKGMTVEITRAVSSSGGDTYSTICNLEIALGSFTKQ